MVDSNGALSGLFFCHGKSAELARRFNIVFIMDCTYKTNRFGMPLLNIVGITATYNTFNAGFAFICNETEPINLTTLATRMTIWMTGASLSTVLASKRLRTRWTTFQIKWRPKQDYFGSVCAQILAKFRGRQIALSKKKDEEHLVRSQRWFWSRRTKQLYRNRYWLTPQVRPKTVKQRHSFALMETLRTCGDSVSLQKYVTRQLLDTSGVFKDPSFDQSRAHGTRYLILARMDALWTARKAIQIGILVDTHPFSVDHCILCDQQLLSTTIAHLVVECEQVTGHRIQSGLVPAIQKSRLRLLGRALDPSVENVYTWLRGGVLNGEADLDQLVGWTGTVEHESMRTRHDNRADDSTVS
ncbi:hypothetical protein BASA81_010656 [Batrachochytrium salamandrivorans]|nr:hypothetical protein BASA81_010656 [Batrachochytrium salamandrivorans]